MTAERLAGAAGGAGRARVDETLKTQHVLTTVVFSAPRRPESSLRDSRKPGANTRFKNSLSLCVSVAKTLGVLSSLGALS